MEKRKNLIFQTKTNDVDEKGLVRVAVNGIGIEDSQGDISMPGAFDNTLKNDITRMRWLLNHDVTQLLGVPLSGEESGGNLIMTGQLNMQKQICKDILADYKLMAEMGRTLEHSIGVQALKRDSEDSRKVLEWKMWEYSTLTGWGANPQTFLVDIKSATRDQVREAIAFLQKALRQPEYSDERLKSFDMQLNLIIKHLEGANVVTCPCCGKSFIWEDQEEHSFAQAVAETAARYTSWVVEDTVREEIDKLKPEIRAEVVAMIDAMKANDVVNTEKSVAEFMTYVRCPHCWSRVYKNMLAASAPKEEPEPVNKFANLLNNINKHF